MSSDLEGTLHERLRAEATFGMFSTGSQLYVSVGAVPIADVAVGKDGLGKEVTRSSLFATYCATKPILTTAIRVGFADLAGCPLSGIVSGLTSELSGLSIEEIMLHRAGLDQITATAAQLIPEAALRQLVKRTPPRLDESGRFASAYSDFQGWALMAMAIEEGFGASYLDVLKSVLDLADDELFLGFSKSELDCHQSRIAVGADLRTGSIRPILREAHPDTLRRWNPAFGGYASARGIGRFYERVLSAGLAPHQRSQHGVSARQATSDLYVDGFMVALDRHNFDVSISPHAFGHAGEFGSCFGLADPARQLVIAHTTSGIVDPTLHRARRASLIQSVIDGAAHE